ncbi:bifunctional DNA primase/polymerase [Pseudonocardia acaciae]|uniref:bifunctional DNA primase/polymerase n=1 Tax=Pseudonocardia acaciae TaxID=551276 RepID=UPI003CCBC43F
MVSYGWPVLRGTYLDDGGCWRGRAGLVDLRPIDDDWQTAWTRKASQVAAWWAEQPYSVLVACGHGVDGVELPVQAGPKVLCALDASDVHPPAMLTPVGTLVLFVQTAPGPRPFLASASLRRPGRGRRCRRLGRAVVPGRHGIGGCWAHHRASFAGSCQNWRACTRRLARLFGIRRIHAYLRHYSR